MKMKMSDVIDRWTILKMKSEFSDVLDELNECESEILNMLRISDKNMTREIINIIVGIAQANARIWENEAAIRKEFDNDPSSVKTLTLEEIGRRAIRIRQLNSKRISEKTKLDIKYGETKDTKTDHLSETK